MRRLRSQKRLGSWTALLALAIQFALSFGHIHFGSGHPRSGSVPIALAWTQSWTTQPASVSPGPSTAPVRRHRASLADDFCAICAATQLAYSPAPVTAAPLPTFVSEILPGPSGDFVVASSTHRPFAARAPPHA
jgi:hypothetical protein